MILVLRNCSIASTSFEEKDVDLLNTCSDRAFSEFLKSVGQFDHNILASGINTYLETKSKFSSKKS